MKPGSSGQFDVSIAGKTVFSKFEKRRFPEEAEVIAAIRALAS